MGAKCKKRTSTRYMLLKLRVLDLTGGASGVTLENVKRVFCAPGHATGYLKYRNERWEEKMEMSAT